MNGIDRVVEELEENLKAAKVLKDTWSYEPVTRTIQRILNLIRRECDGLLGKPLVDIRFNPDKPLSCANCYNAKCETDETASGRPRPATCEVDWRES